MVPPCGGAFDLGGGALTLCVLGPAFLVAEFSLRARVGATVVDDPPPQAARVRRAAPATSASGLFRFMLSSLSYLFSPRTASPATYWIVDRDESASGLGVEGVADRVAQEVEGQHQGDDAEQRLPEVLRVDLEEVLRP